MAVNERPSDTTRRNAVWRSGDPKTKTLNIELPRERIAAILARSPDWLDVWFQDETIVDWIRLTIVYQ